MRARASTRGRARLLAGASRALGVFVLVDTGSIPEGQSLRRRRPALLPVSRRRGPHLPAARCSPGGRSPAAGAAMPDDRACTRRPTGGPSRSSAPGIVLQMALIGCAGFILAGVVLFALVARGFGSTALVRDIVIGAGARHLVYLVFTCGSGATLPAGLLPLRSEIGLHGSPARTARGIRGRAHAAQPDVGLRGRHARHGGGRAARAWVRRWPSRCCCRSRPRSIRPARSSCSPASTTARCSAARPPRSCSTRRASPPPSSPRWRAT